jgi:hypothetical protein
MIITAAATPVDDVDAACVLRKPFNMEQLVEAVHGCLESAG